MLFSRLICPHHGDPEKAGVMSPIGRVVGFQPCGAAEESVLNTQKPPIVAQKCTKKLPSQNVPKNRPKCTRSSPPGVFWVYFGCCSPGLLVFGGCFFGTFRGIFSTFRWGFRYILGGFLVHSGSFFMAHVGGFFCTFWGVCGTLRAVLRCNYRGLFVDSTGFQVQFVRSACGIFFFDTPGK